MSVWALTTALLPHLLHHAIPVVGGAFLAGALGGVVFGVLGLAAMLPFLLGLRRRLGTWLAPAAAVLLFAAVFVGSSVFIGPVVRGDAGPADAADPSPHASGHGH